MSKVFCIPFGGATRIGGSCLYIGTDKKGILVDCGLDIRTGEIPQIPKEIRKKIKAIVITHAHLDHVGALPWIWHTCGRPPIFSTPITAKLAEIVLRDANKVARIRNGMELVDENILKECITSMEKHSFAFMADIPTDAGIIKLYPAGHIPGAAYVKIEMEGTTVVYSGDIADFKQRVVRDAYIPRKEEEHCDLLILESTYGDQLLRRRRSVEVMELTRVVSETLFGGGKVLIPAFAVGRAQEVLLILILKILNREIPRVPVYVDGLVKDVCDVLEREGIDGIDKHVWETEGALFFRKGIVKKVESDAVRAAIINSREPCIVVSSSGMLTAGPAVFYARYFLPVLENALLLVGYQDEESPGRKIMRAESIVLNGEEVPVNCEVSRFMLSAHAHAEGLVRFAHAWNPGSIALVHPPNDEVRRTLAGLFFKAFGKPVILPVEGEKFFPGDRGTKVMAVRGELRDGKLIIDLGDLVREIAARMGEITVRLAGGPILRIPLKLSPAEVEKLLRDAKEVEADAKEVEIPKPKPERKPVEKKPRMEETVEKKEVDLKEYFKLPPEIREYVEQYVRIGELLKKGLSPTQIARELNMPLSTVSDRVKKLREIGFTDHPEKLLELTLDELVKLIPSFNVINAMKKRVAELKKQGVPVSWDLKTKELKFA